MSTILDIITDALSHINVVEPGETPDAGDAASMLRRLNQMIAGWETDGLALKLPPVGDAEPEPYAHADLELTDDWPLARAYEEGVTAMLAIKMARPYGAQADAELKNTASEGWRRLVADFYVHPEQIIDAPLQRNTARQGRGFVSFETLE